MRLHEHREVLREVLTPIGVALDRIATALERWEPVAEPEAPACRHPVEQRLDLGAGQSGWWQCGICGHRAQEVNHADPQA